jgi:hypothetical protein
MKGAVFERITECPECGASLKVENTPEWVIWSCSEVPVHHVAQSPSPEQHRRLREQLLIDTSPRQITQKAVYES